MKYLKVNCRKEEFKIPDDIDTIFFIHYRHKIPPEIYNKYTCIGFHMTDLPYGRGGSPLQNLILRGKKETTLTAFKITDEMDAGDIYLKRELSLSGKAEEIYERVYKLANEMIEEIVKTHPTPKPQGECVEYFSRRVPDDSYMKMITYDRIRMVDAEGYPKAFIDHGNQRIEFIDAKETEKGIEARCLITRRY